MSPLSSVSGQWPRQSAKVMHDKGNKMTPTGQEFQQILSGSFQGRENILCVRLNNIRALFVHLPILETFSMPVQVAKTTLFTGTIYEKYP